MAKTLAQQVRERRLELGLTQEQLGKLIASAGRVVRRIENNEIAPNLSTLQRIAQALFCTCQVELVPEKSSNEVLVEKALPKARQIIEYSLRHGMLSASDKTAKEKLIKDTVKILVEKKRKTLWSK